MAQGKNQILQGGRELNYVSQRDNYTGTLFSRIIKSINSLATNSGVAAVGQLPPPPPIDTISVKGTQTGNVIQCPGEILHFTLTHNSPIQRGLQYISEIDTSPAFTQPHVLDHGCSRSHSLVLPTKDDNGAQQTYYLRSYCQYPGGKPCKPTVVGGLTNATQIVMTGNTNMSLLPSTGSGTAAPNGSQGGKGLGVVLNRPPQGPKRNLSV